MRQISEEEEKPFTSSSNIYPDACLKGVGAGRVTHPPPLTYVPAGLWTGAYLGFCQGGCTFLADLPPSPPPDLDLDPDLDPAPDPHQNNADPQPWAQLGLNCQKIVV
jgi:hypothetical protein